MMLWIWLKVKIRRLEVMDIAVAILVMFALFVLYILTKELVRDIP